ncbi:hypothetical protein E2C01_099658 [Portunus trituberculatus]|uniref:Uncharacterized protein n=1 Tax=Portunus trituberculatus TaxID=210409 RepID=A0A5B7K629_PORTR|nr:hypothetical protein [Portunus trituberculatus]
MYVSQLPTVHPFILKLAYTWVLPCKTDFTLQCLLPWPYFIKANDARSWGTMTWLWGALGRIDFPMSNCAPTYEANGLVAHRHRGGWTCYPGM